MEVLSTYIYLIRGTMLPLINTVRSKGMHKYRLHYLADGDDANWKKCGTTEPVKIGDVLQLSGGFYHVVSLIIQQKTGIRLDLSKSCQSPDEAWLVASQLEHYPKTGRSRVVNPHPKIHAGGALVEL